MNKHVWRTQAAVLSAWLWARACCG